jgi:hypothetical protein
MNHGRIWRERLSLDEVLSTEAAGHVLDLFQEARP